MSQKQEALFAKQSWPLAEGWSLAPEGVAIHRESGTAVIADVHLGYEWSRGWGGDCLPAHSLKETVAKLDRLISRATLDRLIVAGDLVESSAPCERTGADVRALAVWLEGRGVELVVVRGNHDEGGPQREALPDTCDVAGWTVAHGDRPVSARKRIVGHHHPVLRVGGRSVPCFLVGSNMIVLPAFTPNAAGLDVSRGRLPRALREESLHCFAFAGEEMLDFGPVSVSRRRSSRG